MCLGMREGDSRRRRLVLSAARRPGKIHLLHMMCGGSGLPMPPNKIDWHFCLPWVLVYCFLGPCPLPQAPSPPVAALPARGGCRHIPSKKKGKTALGWVARFAGRPAGALLGAPSGSPNVASPAGRPAQLAGRGGGLSLARTFACLGYRPLADNCGYGWESPSCPRGGPFIAFAGPCLGIA